ncbi:MAG TPA: hypothetical protein PK014_14615 [Thermoanaerobaculia bacterium]|nr:hypothetical protein [Thermoanaerobaculia bacterium]
MRHLGIFLLFLSLCTVLTAGTPLFGPESFTRESGGPTEFVATFPACTTDGPLTLSVINGDSSGKNRVSSAHIWLNDTEVLSPSDLNQQTDSVVKPLETIAPMNTLRVQLTAGPGGTLTVEITTEASCGLQIEITQPGDLAYLTSKIVNLEGTVVSEDPQFIVFINQAPGVIIDPNHAGTSEDPYLWYAKRMVYSDRNTFEAKVATSTGEEDTDTITVIPFPSGPLFYFGVQEPDFITGMRVDYIFEAGIASINQVQIDYDGDGEPEETLTEMPDEINYIFDTPGIYFSTLTVRTLSGQTYTDTATVIVQSRDEFEALLQQRWNDFRAALQSENFELIKSFYGESTWMRHEPALRALQASGRFQEAVSQMTDIELVSRWVDGIAECLMIREDETGVNRGHYVSFARSPYGQWYVVDF